MSARAPLSAEAFAAEADVSRETLQRLEAYAALLVKWQRAINLVGPDTIPDLWRRHFLDSAQLLPLLPPASDDRPPVLLDLGSGAGFPALVLAVLAKGAGRPLQVHLVESDRRKSAFLLEAARAADVAGRVTVHPVRAEALDPARLRAPVEVVTARAFAPLDRLLPLAARFAGPHTVLILPKGETAAAELTAADKQWKMTHQSIASRSDARGTILIIRELAAR